MHLPHDPLHNFVSVSIKYIYMSTDQSFVVNLLSDKFILAQRVAGFSCDAVNRPLFHLLLHGAVQHEERLTGTFLRRKNGGKSEKRMDEVK